ncbi:RNA pseudouridylate synthase domain-containing protein 2-like isoform X3 [Penaeus chinensis]|uniref:RNA pseudouridylate synthase domain-containing protein 2-like isoform X3 n=1 Tax=Penaeus chinensis TaxID=139456 RepID=UPI001FB71559|nr:RNA pseudouridylate synthase domain-containing protein 2-like isoform X3 [Penaeus chinensis]
MPVSCKLFKFALVRCHVSAFSVIQNNCQRTIASTNLLFTAIRSFHRISEHRRYLALHYSDCVRSCGIGARSCSAPGIRFSQSNFHLRTLVHFIMSDTKASEGMEKNGENPHAGVQEPAAALGSDVQDTKGEQAEDLKGQCEESGEVAEAMEKCKVEGELDRETTILDKETNEPNTKVAEPGSDVTDPKKEGTESVKEMSEPKETPSKAEGTEVEEGNTPENVPKKSKNQIKKEKRRALWNQNREMYKEMKRLRKEEKEKQIMEMEKRMAMQQSEESEETQDVEFNPNFRREKRKADDEFLDNTDIKKAKLETKALKAKRPGFSEERYNETSYYIENGLRKVYPYYFTFTTFTKGRWVGEKILDVFAKEFRAHPAEEYERCIKSGTLTVNYEKVDVDYRLKHNDLLANIVHRHEVPVTSEQIPIVHVDEDLVVVDKPASIPVHPCGRYRHNTVVFILAKEYNLKNLRTIHRLDRLTSGLLLFGRTPKKAREMEQQIRTRQVTKEYVCRVEGEFPREHIECNEPIEVVSYKIGVCKVSPTGKDCRTEFTRLSYNGKTSVVLCRPHTGRMHQIRVHLQYLGYPIVNDPLYNHTVFGPNKGKGGIVAKTDEQLIQDLIKIHNAENWLGMDGDAEYSMFKGREKTDNDEEGGSQRNTPSPKEKSPSAADAPRVTSPPALIAQSGYASPKPLTSSLDIQPSMVGAEAVPPKTINGCSSGLVGSDGLGVVSAGTQTSEGNRDYGYQPRLMTVDEHCYECKVRYRDPKPRDLVMYLHALKYMGPGWQYETKLPEWASEDWKEPEDDH